MKKFSCILVGLFVLVTMFAGIASANDIDFVDGFNETFANVNFENYTVTDTISSTATTLGDSTVKGDVSLLNIDGEPVNENDRGMVMKITGKSWNSRICTARTAWEAVYKRTTNKTTVNPPVVKAEIEVKTSHADFDGANGRIYIVARDTNGRECILASFYASSKGVRKLCFGRSDQGNIVPEGNSEKVDKNWVDDTYHKLTFYFDFTNNCYDAYLDGSYVGNFVLDNTSKANVTDLMYFGMGTSAANIVAYIDNMNVNVLPFDNNFDKIVKYKTHSSNENAACLIKNSTNSAIKVNMITAKYAKADNRLVTVEIDEVDVAAWQRGYFTKNMTTNAESDLQNYYYKVFAFDSMSTLVPRAGNANLEIKQ